MDNYLYTHTKIDRIKKANDKLVKSPYETIRNSTATVLSWTREMLSDDVDRVQSACKEPMKLLGYKRINITTQNLNLKLDDIMEIGDKWQFMK